MLKLLASFLGFLALAVAPASAQAPQEPTTLHHVFHIVRDGNPIGTTTIDVDKQDDTTTVHFKTHISVVVLFVEAYRYESAGTEIWKAGRFVSYQSHTNDHGKHYSVSAIADGDKLDFTVNGVSRVLPQIVLPATFWNTNFVDQAQLFDPDKGTIMSIKVADLGQTAIKFHGDPVQVEHYRISGDFPRDIWVDGTTPIRIKMLAPDHSTIISSLAALPVGTTDPEPGTGKSP